MKLTFNKINITGKLLDFSIEFSLDDIFATLNFSLPHSFIKANGIKEGQQVQLEDKNLKFQGICLKYTDENNNIGKFMCVNFAWYLTVHEDTFQINSTAKEAVKKVITSYDNKFKFKDISEKEFSNTKIVKLYYEMSLESIVKDIIGQVTSKSASKYYVIDNGGTFEVVKNSGEISIDIKNLWDLKRECDISKIKNQIKVISASEKNVNSEVIVKNSESIKAFGTIQKVSKIKSKDKVQGKAEAEKLLKLLSNLDKTISFSIPGNLKIKVGSVTKLNGTKYLIKKVKHELKDGLFRSSLELEVYYG